MRFQCIVVGGGAAGMMSAIHLARRGVKVAIIEHTDRLGTKLLQTGNGRCNFTNLHMEMECFRSETPDFVENVIDQFNVKDIINFFEGIGIYCRDRDGYVYPHSNTASSLQNAMRLELEHLGVNIFYENDIKDITYKGFFKLVMSDKTKLECDRLVIATGSKAAAKTGSDGSGYELANILGHRIIKPLPALVPLISDNKHCKLVAGVRSNSTVTLYIDDKEVTSDTGEVQFTDYGISGIPVFQISHWAVKGVDSKSKVSVKVDLIPDYNLDDLKSIIKKAVEHNADRTVEQLLEGLVNKKLITAVLKRIGENSSIPARQIIEKIGQDDFADKISKALKNYDYRVTGYKDFNQAQVCSGGVDLSEIESKTCESKLVKGLYFAGEVMDVDGICGGYNLTWAWSSAYVVSKAIADTFIK